MMFKELEPIYLLSTFIGTLLISIVLSTFQSISIILIYTLIKYITGPYFGKQLGFNHLLSALIGVSLSYLILIWI